MTPNEEVLIVDGPHSGNVGTIHRVNGEVITVAITQFLEGKLTQLLVNIPAADLEVLGMPKHLN